MTRSSRKKEYGESSKLSEDNCTVGTAARTRPFSFDEIMLQRKQKKQPADVKEVIGGELLGEETTEKVPNAVKSYRKRNEHYLHGDEKHAFEDSVDLNSRKKDEGKLFNVNRESHKSERKSKTSPKRSGVVDRAKRGEIDEHDYGKRKSNKYNDSAKESERKHSRHYVTEDKHAEKNRGNTEQEGKRKHRNEDDRKAKDRNATKKHDSYKGREPEPKEKRERNEPSKVLNEVSRLKRRRSRSREHANDTGRRSTSPSPRVHKIKHVSHAGRDHGELSVHSFKDRPKRSNPDIGSPEPKEKSGNKEPSKVVNEDFRLRRRRSRSRERTKDTGRRSISLSPRANKHVSHAVRGGELSAQSSKDRSGRSNSDFDSTRMSNNNNGFSGHHRRHGSSASKLGGYSPRKRRTESAAKTPSPTIRSPEKRSAGWDHPPSKSESSFNGSVLSNLQSSSQIVSANLPHVSMTVPVSDTTMTGVGVMSTASSPRVETSLDSIQLTQATRPSRRLYVENISTATSEESVMKCINKFILSLGGHHVQGTHPCISCIINKEKNQALVEFLTQEDASAALSLDGSTFEDSILKVRRPKDFFDASTGIPRKSVSEVGSVSNTVKDSPHKIFVGGISKAISSDMLMEIASIFGPLRAYRYEVNTDLNEPCAFLEYVDQSMTKKACAGLNGMKLGGKVLTVVQAMQNASLIANDENSPSYEIPLHAKPLLEEPAHVLKLKNVIDSQYLSLISESELEEMLEDIRLECARFGTVVSVNVVKTQNPIIAPETNGVGDFVSAVDEADLEYDDSKTRTEVQPDSVHHDLGELGSAEPSSSHNFEETVDADVHISSDDQINMLEQSSRVSKPEDGAEAMETSSMADDKLLDNLEKDQVHQPMQGDEGATVVEHSASQEDSNISIKISNQFDICVDNKEIPDDSFKDNSLEVPQVENRNSFEQEKHGKENSMLDGASSDLDHNVSKELDGTENGKKEEFDQGNVFEPGCVLVEFRRTEASCMAAHCLHGRLFDDHVVTVNYVDLDSYRNRFPK
ncbi:splicing factor U2af large subunit B [Heracleum sosnowskyi]|uniref:Splicing factor U2af large subunit B n=1 Tax=Heracleum sosnowskyi TaxID=360622 RepID=A0AAD8N3K4_9APIA|nr:splicing factor U2af large subunit B [Heracleum sosnowskyi]